VVQKLPKWGGMIQEAPQAQKMLKNQSSQNWMKPTPLRPARSPDSGHIFTFSNGRCMRELSYSDRFPKQAKSQQVQSNDDIMTSAVLTWQRQVVTSGSPAEGDWSVTGIQPTTDKWHLFGKWLGATWPSHGLPRGTMVLVNGWWKNVMELMGFEPMTSW
jgi:hypothetical protein